MPTHYVMKEMPDLQGKGERVTYPQMVLLGQSSTRELAEYISLRSGFSPGMVEGIICELAEAMAHTMARGFSAKIDGIGTFPPGLVIGADKEREEADGDATHRNAQSIFVGKINFQAEKELVYKTNRHCTLRRAPWKPVRSSQEYTAGQRLEIARKHLEAHPFLTVRTYCQLTGLLRSSGTVELRKLSHTPGTGIGFSGFGSHRVYIKSEE